MKIVKELASGINAVAHILAVNIIAGVGVAVGAYVGTKILNKIDKIESVNKRKIGFSYDKEP